MELNSKNIKKILLIIFLGVLIFSAFQNLGFVIKAIGNIFTVISPVVVALCIAFVLNILLTTLETKIFKFWDKVKNRFILKLKRPVCLLLTYLIFFGVISLLILVIIPDIIETITYIADRMPAFVLQAQAWSADMLAKFNLQKFDLPELKIDWHSIASNLINWLSGSSGKIVNSALNITTSVFSGVFDTVFSLVISVYVLAQKERIGDFVKRLAITFLPSKTNGFITHICSKTHELFSRFIGGQLLEAIILGTLCFIGMSIFSFPNALIISVLICVTALVPIIGAAVGVIFGFLLIVITDPIKALLFVLFFIVLQQIEGNLIYPRVVGKAVGLPGVLVVSAVMVGGNIGGILGALISVPTVAVFYTLLKELIEFSNPQSGHQRKGATVLNDEVEYESEDSDDSQQ